MSPQIKSLLRRSASKHRADQQLIRTRVAGVEAKAAE
jgi:hypothetical protein